MSLPRFVRDGVHGFPTFRAFALLGLLAAPLAAVAAENGANIFSLKLRSRVEAPELGGAARVVEQSADWNPRQSAIIVCDMWDLHHCLNATRRGGELAPRIDQLLKEARQKGVVVIHAPSSCMDAYKDHPARLRAQKTPRSASLPAGIALWCRQIPAEEKNSYPVDQTNGGEDDDNAEHTRWQARLAALGRNPAAPWKAQTNAITIDGDSDYLSDNGEEIWSVLENRGIQNVMLLGVHLNMCVLGRPFGLRQLAKNGKNVVLVRDLTDTMYDPRQAPFVSHFTGTDRMVEHVERFVCPSITSNQILGGNPFRFRGDTRPHVVFVVGDDEYKTESTLPPFAATQLGKNYRVSFVFNRADDRNDLPGLDVLDDADLMFLSARRRILPKEQLAAIRRFVGSGKPVIGIRTASHAFAARNPAEVTEGREVWNSFDPDVLGGHYVNHYPVGPKVVVAATVEAKNHPILTGVDVRALTGHGSLYKVAPLVSSATPLLTGTIPESAAEPIAWTNLTNSGGRVFYTSLGHAEDFAEPAFTRLLRNAIDWSLGRDVPENVESASADPIAFPGTR